MIETIFREMQRGNFSFLILVVGIVQAVLMWRKNKLKQGDMVICKRTDKVGEVIGIMHCRDSDLDSALVRFDDENEEWIQMRYLREEADDDQEKLHI